jgi:hypothetical protein
MSTYSAILTQIIYNVTLYVDVSTLIFGTIGSICNLITFTGRQMRPSPSVFYLLCATVFQLLSILFGVGTRLAFYQFGSNFNSQPTGFCKLRYYFVVTLPFLASHYIFLSVFDRCLATSENVRIRAWSQNKVAYRLSATSMVVVFAISIHILIFYGVYNNICQIRPGSIYTFFFTAYLIIIVSLMPHLLMLIFSLITISALRKTGRRVIPSITVKNTQNHRRTQHLEFQLIKVSDFTLILINKT